LNLSVGIFKKIFSAKTESFRMDSLKKTLSERNLSAGIFQKKSFRNDFMTHGRPST
jgi:hypothetical protein